MKIGTAFFSSLLNNLPSVSSVWRGRTISPFASGFVAGSFLTTTATAVVIYLAYRMFSQTPTSSKQDQSTQAESKSSKQDQSTQTESKSSKQDQSTQTESKSSKQDQSTQTESNIDKSAAEETHELDNSALESCERSGEEEEKKDQPSTTATQSKPPTIKSRDSAAEETHESDNSASESCERSGEEEEKDPFDKYNITATKPKTVSPFEAKIILGALDCIDQKNLSKDSAGCSPFDPAKDRYQNILQLYSTMVEVYIKDIKVDYNGALFMNPVNSRIYILMQGPLSTTLSITKEMIKQNNVKQVVCLTNHLDEKGNINCHPYWEHWESNQEDGFPIRRSSPKEEWSSFEMFHYENWPDHGVPKDIDELIKFVELQRKMYVGGSTVVHCSAGIGRTGVFMVINWMMDRIKQGDKELNPVKIIAQLRRVRPGMVQTPEQLQFCFQVAGYLLKKI